MERIRKILFSNIRLKLIALMCSIALWLFVTNVSDPTTSVRFYNIPVEMQNTELIEMQGDVYTVLDGTDMVSYVTVTGPRSVIDSLSDSNIKATADFRNLTAIDTVNITFSSTRYGEKITALRGSSDTLKLSVETRQTRNFVLRVTTEGEPEEGFVRGDMTLEQNQVRISGPASVVSSIAGARTTVQIGGASSTINTTEDIELYDADGNIVSQKNLTMNINSVKVNVQILPTKVLSVRANYVGVPEEGFLVSSFSIEPAEVRVAGRGAVLAKMENMEIPAEVVDITGADSDVEKVLDVSKYLEEGAFFAEPGFDGKVKITVHIEAVSYKTFKPTASQVMITDIPDGYEAVLCSENGTELEDDEDLGDLILSGLTEDLEEVKPQNLTLFAPFAQVNFENEDNKAGLYTMTAACALPKGTSLVSAPRLYIRLVREEN